MFSNCYFPSNLFRYSETSSWVWLRWKPRLASTIYQRLYWNEMMPVGLEASSNQLIHYVFAIGQMEMIVIFYAFRNHCRLLSFVKLCEINAGPTHNANYSFSLGQMPRFYRSAKQEYPSLLMFYKFLVL